MHQITEEQQLKELTSRIPPVLNVNLVVVREGECLVGRHPLNMDGPYLFPGGRMKFDETLEQAVDRIATKEIPGLMYLQKRFITALSSLGADARSNNVSLYYLLQYLSGEPGQSKEFGPCTWFPIADLPVTTEVHWSDRKTHADLIQAISLANSTEDELLVEVDNADNEIGRILKRDAHMTPDRSHRSMMILVFNTKGELILHQRSKNKSNSPLAWDFFGGHQQIGFSQEETAKAELYEELGIQTPVKFLMKRLHKTTTQSEYQYFYTSVSDGPYAYDRNEVEQVSFFDPQCVALGKYDAEFRLLPHVKEVVNFFLRNPSKHV